MGEVYLNDKKWSPRRTGWWSQGVSLVPEGRWIFPNLTVEENLLLAATPAGTGRTGLSGRLPCSRGRGAQKAAGGHHVRRRAADASHCPGLMSNPKVLLLDEPSLGLAPLIVNDIMSIIRQINGEGISVLLVEQNARKALSIAHHACVLEQGQIVKTGTGAELAADESIVAAYLGKTKKRGKRGISRERAYRRPCSTISAWRGRRPL